MAIETKVVRVSNFLLGIIVLSVFSNPATSYSLDFAKSGQAHWLLSLPISHKKFVLKFLWEKSVYIFTALVIFAIASLAVGKKLYSVKVWGAVIAFVTLILTSITIASLSAVSFSFRNSHGWRKIVGFAIYALFIIFVVGICLSFAATTSSGIAQWEPKYSMQPDLLQKNHQT